MDIGADLTTQGLLADNQDLERLSEISRCIPGYSDARHYLFFRRLLATTGITNILILGVYFGRDIAFILEAAPGHAVHANWIWIATQPDLAA